MLRHIVMWKFNEGIDKEKIGEEIKVRLLSLCDKIPAVSRAEVIYNTLSSSTHDIMLSMDVANETELQKYASSQEHTDIAERLIKPNTNSRCAVDYEF